MRKLTVLFSFAVFLLIVACDSPIETTIESAPEVLFSSDRSMPCVAVLEITNEDGQSEKLQHQLEEYINSPEVQKELKNKSFFPLSSREAKNTFDSFLYGLDLYSHHVNLMIEFQYSEDFGSISEVGIVYLRRYLGFKVLSAEQVISNSNKQFVFTLDNEPSYVCDKE